MLIAELWQRASLPDGVFNVVHGDKVAVDTLLDSPDVAAVSFVGSTPIARSDSFSTATNETGETRNPSSTADRLRRRCRSARPAPSPATDGAQAPSTRVTGPAR